MRLNPNLKAIIILLVAIIFMYQETKAQPKKPKGKAKTPAVVEEAKPVPPEVSYAVSMSKPWTHFLEVEMRVKCKPKCRKKAKLQCPFGLPAVI